MYNNYILHKFCKGVLRETHMIGIDNELVIYAFFDNGFFVEIHIPSEEQKEYPIAIFLCYSGREKEVWGIKYEDIGKEVNKLYKYSKKMIRDYYKKLDEMIPRELYM